MFDLNTGIGIIIGIVFCSLIWGISSLIDFYCNRSEKVDIVQDANYGGFSIWASVQRTPGNSPVFYDVRYHDVFVCRIPFLTHAPRELVNGLRFEDVIRVLIHRYDEVQNGKYSNNKNTEILALLKEVRSKQFLAVSHPRAKVKLNPELA